MISESFYPKLHNITAQPNTLLNSKCYQQHVTSTYSVLTTDVGKNGWALACLSTVGKLQGFNGYLFLKKQNMYDIFAFCKCEKVQKQTGGCCRYMACLITTSRYDSRKDNFILLRVARNQSGEVILFWLKKERRD